MDIKFITFNIYSMSKIFNDVIINGNKIYTHIGPTDSSTTYNSIAITQSNGHALTFGSASILHTIPMILTSDFGGGFTYTMSAIPSIDNNVKMDFMSSTGFYGCQIEQDGNITTNTIEPGDTTIIFPTIYPINNLPITLTVKNVDSNNLTLSVTSITIPYLYTNFLINSSGLNKAITISVDTPITIKEVTIYTKIGDINHYDLNNRFQIVLVSELDGLVYGTYIGWQSSWSSPSSTFDYYSPGDYDFSEMLNSVPLPQRLNLDFKLEQGTYTMYIDETYNIGGIHVDNADYIQSSVYNSYTYFIPDVFTVLGPSSYINQRGCSDIGDIFFDWVIEGENSIELVNGSLTLKNNLPMKTIPAYSIFSTTTNGFETLALKNKIYGDDSSIQPSSSTVSMYINPIGNTTSNILKIGSKTSIQNYYNSPTGFLMMANSNNIGNWTKITATSGVGNAVGRTLDFFIGGATTSQFLYDSILSVWSANLLQNTKKVSFNIIDNLTFQPVYGITVSIYTPMFSTELHMGIKIASTYSLPYPGWKIIIT